MKITKNALKRLIKEELEILLETSEVDPTADPEIAIARPKTPEEEAEAKKAKKADTAPGPVKIEKTLDTIRRPEEYAAVLKDVFLGSALSATKKKKAFMKVFGDKMGLKVWSILIQAAPGVKK
tara:strand:+ start:4959 stop:5327 length:369 start_codon:yes stop_codon:yes gene_type:complete